MPAIILPYTIHTAFGTSSPQTTKSVTIFDIRVPLPCPAETAAQEAIAAGLKAATLKQISVLAAQQELLIQALLQANTKQRQLSQMAAAPVEYLNRWTNSQYGDLRLVLGEELAGVGPLRSSVANATILTEEWRQSGSGSIWNSNGVREGVKNWITSEASTNRRARR